MRPKNDCEFVGNVVRNPERPAPNRPVNFTLAVQRPRGPDGKDTGVDFVDFDIWGEQGDVVLKSVEKGNRLYVEGSYRRNKVEGNDGKVRDFHGFRVRSWAKLETAEKPSDEEDSTNI